MTIETSILEALTAKVRSENSCHADTKTKQEREIQRPGPSFCFPHRRSFSQHASHSSFHPSVTRQLWLPLVPLLWRRILLCEVVSDQSHGGQVTELKFRSVPYQSSAHETQTVSPKANSPEQKQRFFFLVLVCFKWQFSINAFPWYLLTIYLLELLSKPNTQHCNANASAKKCFPL